FRDKVCLGLVHTSEVLFFNLSQSAPQIHILAFTVAPIRPDGHECPKRAPEHTVIYERSSPCEQNDMDAFAQKQSQRDRLLPGPSGLWQEETKNRRNKDEGIHSCPAIHRAHNTS